MITDTQFFLMIAAAVVMGVSFLGMLVRSKRNNLEWADLIATNGVMNAYKIGYWFGVGIGSWVIVKSTYMGDLDSVVFAAYLTFLGGVPVAATALSRVPPPRSPDAKAKK